MDSYTRDTIINFKVYIAGEYCPAQSVTCQGGTNTFSQARISLFPHKDLIDLGDGDRVPVQIFFLDPWVKQNPIESKYRLMFDGEIVSTLYNRTPNSISLDIECVNYFQILAQLFVILFTNIVDEINTLTLSAEATDNNELGIPQLLGKGLLTNYDNTALPKTYKELFSKDIVKKIVEQNSKNESQKDTFIKRPFSLIRNILYNLIVGKFFSSKSNDVHLFLMNYICKKNLLRGMVASPVLEEITNSPLQNTILNAVSTNEYRNIILNGISLLAQSLGTGQRKSYLEVILQLYNLFMYEIVSPLCPPIVNCDIYGVPNKKAKASFNSIPNLISKPALTSGIPPRCNIIFPSMINNTGKRNDHLTKPTRFYFINSNALQNMNSGGGANQSVVSSIAIQNLSIVWPPELNKKIASVTPTEQSTDESGNIDNRTAPNYNKEIIYKDIQNIKFDALRTTLVWDTSTSKGSQNEFFKGPITMMSKMVPEWVNYIGRSINNPELSKVKTDKNDTIEAYKKEVTKFLSIYAATEFEKEKASRKQVNLELKFNPYLMVGYPVVVFDSLISGQYYYGILSSVSHRMGQDGAATSVQITNYMSFEDANSMTTVYEDVAKTNLETTYEIGPVHPAYEIRRVFNSADYSYRYYQSLLYQDIDDSGVSNANSDDEKTKKTKLNKYIFIPDLYFNMEKNQDGKLTGKINTGSSKTIFAGIKTGYKELFTSYERALEHVSRYIVNIDEYIDEYLAQTKMVKKDGITDVPNYLTTGVKKNKRLFTGAIITPDQDKRNVAKFYDKIINFRYMTESRFLDKTTGFPKRPTDIDNYPDFKIDWMSKIKKYREEILSRKDIRVF